MDVAAHKAGPGASASELDETIRMVRESAAALDVRSGDLSRIRALRDRPPGFDPDVWARICALDWLAMRRPDEMGAPAFDMRAFCALAEELGAGLVPEPVIGAVTAACLLPAGSADEVCAGRRLVALAWQETPGALASSAPTVRKGRLTARRIFVPFAEHCENFVVPIEHGAALVDRAAAGVRLEPIRLQDGTNAANIVFEDAPFELLTVDTESALEAATLATAAYLLGLMECASEISLAYLRERRQFGGPIGRFQVLRHGAVDLSIQIALARASIEEAARSFDRAPLHRRSAAVSRAKARASNAALTVTRRAIQFHGAIGYTDEANPGLYLRKAMVASAAYGGASCHRRRYLHLARGAALA